jgi:P4 family phage/plasmid primase-like protien
VANTAATPAKNVLTFSDALAAIDGKGPSKSGWYNGLCPAHADSQASLGIKELSDRTDGTFAIKCQAGCSRKDVIAALEQKTGKPFGAGKNSKEKRPPAQRGITLQQYADLKKLPAKYLRSFGTFETVYEGKPAVVHTYHDENVSWNYLIWFAALVNEKAPIVHNAKTGAGLKYRLSVDSHDTVWVDYEKPAPYGVAHLLWASKYNKIDTIVVCEGESDVQTLFFNGIPALGISGKKGWNAEFAKIPHLKDLKEVVIIKEPDAEDFVEAVAASFPDKRVSVMEMSEQCKDPSAMWLLSKTQKEFLARWGQAVDGAKLINDSFSTSDTGNAERLVAMYGGDFRWLDDEETFCVWNKSVWRKNTSGQTLLPWTKDVVQSIPNDEGRQTSESSAKRTSMIAMTKGETDVIAQDDIFDRHPMLLNVANGTLDLETQLLRDFSREDFLTKKSPVSYDTFANCPQFDEFMNFTFGGDQDLVHFMDKALGYTLTGKVDESCFFICYGLGANGKTTLIEVMMQILGPDFGRPAKFSTFISSGKMGDSKYELATFKGRRMITAMEPRKAGHLDEEVLKQMTGGDQIMARDIYKANVVYYPEFKLWLSMNNQPRIVGTDEGIWRRVRFIPFLHTVPESRKVKDFHKVLFHKEGPGILNRLLNGLRSWQEEGLQMPKAIADATSEFRAAQNVIQGFFDTHTLSGKRNYHVKAGDLYDAYRRWAEDQNEFVIRSNEFAEELKRRQFVKRRMHDDGSHWWGITLKTAPAESEPTLGLDNTDLE